VFCWPRIHRYRGGSHWRIAFLSKIFVGVYSAKKKCLGAKFGVKKVRTFLSQKRRIVFFCEILNGGMGVWDKKSK